MIDVRELLRELREEPYETQTVCAPHCGIVEFVVTEPGTKVNGPSGVWKETPGTLLVRIDREHNKKPIFATRQGVVVQLFPLKNGQFVQAGQELMLIRHYLTREEVITRILRRALYLFDAPEKGKYYFTPDVGIKVKTRGCQSVSVEEGGELFILSRMKRETQIRYSGPSGIIYSVYFHDGESVDRNSPLIGVCPEEQVDQIQDVVRLVETDWEEVG